MTMNLAYALGPDQSHEASLVTTDNLCDDLLSATTCDVGDAP